MKQERCIILIDGSNFYFKLKDLQLSNLLDFDFSAFARFLYRERTIVKTVYYIGKVRTDGSSKAKRMLADQQRLLAHLRKQQFTTHLATCSNQTANTTRKVLT